MILVVADTGPINYLIQIGAIDVLGKLFDEVVIPDLVQRELSHHGAPASVRSWAMNLPAWVTLRTADFQPVEKLDPAETQAITLAEELHAFAVIVDDYDARQFARAKGIRVFGTTGILEEAAKLALLDLRGALTALQATNFRGSPEVYNAALEREAIRKRAKE